MYISTKTYTHGRGLSCAFRQWRAESHCRYLHGYSIQIGMQFAAKELDERNWVVDFGSLKSFKGLMEDTFDHKTVVAEDDPELATFKELHRKGLIQLMILPRVGCEGFAFYIAGALDVWLADNGYQPRVRVHQVEVREHDANSAIYVPRYDSMGNMLL